MTGAAGSGPTGQDATAARKTGADARRKRRSRLGQVLAIFAGVLGVIASIIAIYNFVKPAGPPSFSGNLADNATAATFSAFLGQHVDQKVRLSVICDGPEYGACGIAPTSSDAPPQLVLTGDPVHSALWCAQNDGECSGYAVIQLSSWQGSFSQPGGAGTISITGTWRVQNYHGGGIPGTATAYELIGQG